MEEKVKDYINTIKKKMTKWIITEFIADIVEIVAFVIIILKATNNLQDLSNLIYIAICMFVVMLGTILISIKLYFGSVKGFSKISSTQGKYNFALQNLKNAKKDFDEGKIGTDELNKAENDYNNMISEIANEI